MSPEGEGAFCIAAADGNAVIAGVNGVEHETAVFGSIDFAAVGGRAGYSEIGGAYAVNQNVEGVCPCVDRVAKDVI